MKYFYLGDDFMPGYVTHYIFGRDMYEKLNDPVLKNNLYKNRAVYALGHQGPDIFSIICRLTYCTDTIWATWRTPKIPALFMLRF